MGSKQLALVQDALKKAHPLHGLLADVLEEVGGIDFVVNWAEEHPTQFMQILMASIPAAVQPKQQDAKLALHIHPGLEAGPLDVQGETIDG